MTHSEPSSTKPSPIKQLHPSPFTPSPLDPAFVLDHFNYCPSCGASEVSRFQENAISCERCDFVLFFNPTSSAATLIADSQGRLLTIVRAKDPAKGKYGLPGGFVDYGETAKQAAIRETKEELNIDLQQLEYLGAWPNRYAYKNVEYPVLDTYFIGTVSSFDGVSPERAEVQRIEFVDPATVPEGDWAFDSLRQAIKAYRARFPQSE